MTVLTFSVRSTKLTILSSIISLACIQNAKASSATATLDVPLNKIATVTGERQIVINDGDILQKTGAGRLDIAYNQGQSNSPTPTEQDGLSGIVALKEGEIRIGDNNALGNNHKFNSGYVSASDNYLLMSSYTTLSASADISGLAVPIKIDSSAVNVFNFDSNGHSLALGAIAATIPNNAKEMGINLKNLAGGSMSTIKLNGAYTMSSNTDMMYVRPLVNLETSSAANLAPHVELNSGSKMTVTASFDLPYLVVTN